PINSDDVQTLFAADPNKAFYLTSLSVSATAGDAVSDIIVKADSVEIWRTLVHSSLQPNDSASFPDAHPGGGLNEAITVYSVDPCNYYLTAICYFLPY